MPKKQPNTTSHKHNIGNMTGRQFESYLEKTVDKNWNHGDEHHFHQGKSESSDFKIKVVNERRGQKFNQLGNGIVEFPSDESPKKWVHRKDDLQSSSFQSSRKKYLDQKLSCADFNDANTRGNIMLGFEGARRKEGEDFPIARAQVKDAIGNVMSTNDRKSYQKNVSRMLNMFGSEVPGETTVERNAERVAALNELLPEATTSDGGIDDITAGMRSVKLQNDYYY